MGQRESKSKGEEIDRNMLGNAVEQHGSSEYKLWKEQAVHCLQDNMEPLRKQWKK